MPLTLLSNGSLNSEAVNTFSGAGFSENLSAATRKMSGYGLPLFTAGSEEPQILYGNKLKSSWWFVTFKAYVSLLLLVANPIGTLFSWRWRISFSTPAISIRYYYPRTQSFKLRYMDVSTHTGHNLALWEKFTKNVPSFRQKFVYSHGQLETFYNRTCKFYTLLTHYLTL